MACRVWINWVGRGMGATGDRGLSFRGLWTAVGSGAVWNRFASATPWRELFGSSCHGRTSICLLVGYFLVPRIDMLYSYYGVAGYGYESIPKSFSLIGRLLLQFVSGPYLFVCAAILVAGWLFRLVASGWLYRRLPAWEIWGSLAGSVWLATATFLFLGLSRQIADARHAVFPGIILMLVGCFWPWRSRPPEKDAWQLLCRDPMLGPTVRPFLLGFSLLLFSHGCAVQCANKGFIVADHPAPAELEEKGVVRSIDRQDEIVPARLCLGGVF